MSVENKVGKIAVNPQDVSIEERLIALARLQKIDSEIDKIRSIRGELPLEVQDLEDEIAGLQTRIENFQTELKQFEEFIQEKKGAMINAQSMIKRYEDQRNNVRNNREYDSLTKEINYELLEIEHAEKLISEKEYALKSKSEMLEVSKNLLKERSLDLDNKKSELNEIISETEKDEVALLEQSAQNEAYIEERLLTAYKRIRSNARNGLAVVSVDRDACGGCFSKIPPQRQMDIRIHKKIIVCEYCGRILTDASILEKV